MFKWLKKQVKKLLTWVGLLDEPKQPTKQKTAPKTVVKPKPKAKVSSVAEDEAKAKKAMFSITIENPADLVKPDTFISDEELDALFELTMVDTVEVDIADDVSISTTIDGTEINIDIN